MAKEIFNPSTLMKPAGYSHVAKVSGGTLVYIAGQVSADVSGQLVGEGNLEAQAEQVFKNLRAALASVGASCADIVKLNSYLKDIADLPILREVRATYLNAAALPASTTLEVPGFARPDALLEIEAVAVLPLQTARARPSAGKPKLKTARRKAR